MSVSSLLSYNTLVVLAGTSLLGAVSGLVGSFAVLRRRSLTGDALAHASLPGLCLAFLIVGSRSLPAMLLGAFISGILGVACISGLRRWTRIKEDAAIGIVLSVFFGFGIVLSVVIQNQTTGGSKAGLNSYILGYTAGMLLQDVYLIAALAGLCLAVIVALYKEFKLTAFDPDFGRALGQPSLALDLLLMALIAVAVVIALPAVGVVLSAALLIIPGAAARFWTDRLVRMLVIAVAIGSLIGVVGTLLTAACNLPAGPTLVLVGTGLFLLSMLFAPNRGVLARARARTRFRDRLGQEQLLRRLASSPSASLGTMAETQRWLYQLRLAGLVVRSADGEMSLTTAGWHAAAQAVLDYRLWELLVEESPELASQIVPGDRASIEEVVPREELAELEIELKRQGRSPDALSVLARESTP
ncbi:MAG TPA: metal ABC transporter permease [Planctomycetaceae bacterium]|nr:metal ABC transporter permease [Planctomycetaceae bacterium]